MKVWMKSIFLSCFFAVGAAAIQETTSEALNAFSAQQEGEMKTPVDMENHDMVTSPDKERNLQLTTDFYVVLDWSSRAHQYWVCCAFCAPKL